MSPQYLVGRGSQLSTMRAYSLDRPMRVECANCGKGVTYRAHKAIAWFKKHKTKCKGAAL